MINKIKEQFFTVKFTKFVGIGIWNTFFGIGIFFVLFYFLHQYLQYMILVIISNILAITNAYIFYKIFVFKTKGNYLKEYLRFYVVYGLVFIVSVAIFPFFMEIIIPFLQSHMPSYSGIFHYKAYIAQIFTVSVTMFVSYFGHEKFSYRKKKTSLSMIN